MHLQFFVDTVTNQVFSGREGLDAKEEKRKTTTERGKPCLGKTLSFPGFVCQKTEQEGRKKEKEKEKRKKKKASRSNTLFRVLSD